MFQLRPTAEEIEQIRERSAHRYLMDDGLNWAIADGDKLFAEIDALREENQRLQKEMRRVAPFLASHSVAGYRLG